MKNSVVMAVLVAVIFGYAIVGCAPRSREWAPQEPLIHAARRNLGKIDWPSFTTDELILLFSRTDPKQEQTVLGGLDASVSFFAGQELERRMGDKGINGLLLEQRDRLLRAIRGFLSDERYWLNRPMLEFAAKYDPEGASEFFIKHPQILDFHAEAAFPAIVKAGREREVWGVIKHRLDSGDEDEVCQALWFVAQGKMKMAADAVYARTRALRWPIRLNALYALDQLDDSRTTEALRTHLADIERFSPGLRIFGGFLKTLQIMMQTGLLRTELVKALVRRNVPGGAEALERMALNGWEGPSTVRMAAGVGLAKLDRTRGIAAVRRLLRGGEGDQIAGVGIASHGLAAEVKDDLEWVVAHSSHDLPKDMASGALRDLKESGGRSSEEVFFGGFGAE
jgi:hypothetical protein